MSISIGVPRERKAGEKRVAITPDGVKRLIPHAAKILIETAAGIGSGFSDQQYIEAGAEVVNTLEKVWKSVDLLVKVKEPAEEEYTFFREDLSIFSFLHPAAFPLLTQKMVESGLTALDYDLLTLANGSLPILEPMSVIAGKLSVQCGAFALQSSRGGAGVLLGGASGVPAAKVVVIGCGAAGSNAAQVAFGMGAETVVLDIAQEKLTAISHSYPGIRTALSSEEAIRREISDAYLVIGSVLIPGDKAPKLITRDMLAEMIPGAVIVDICIDQGGFAETSHPTTISEPTFIKERVVHYCVANMPALVPRTSTQALTAVTLPWIEMLAKLGILPALEKSTELLSSLTTYKGKLSNKTVGAALDLPAISAHKAIKS